MHIKRFVARDMKHAIRLVRDEQGPDAVILSNQRVQGGIEIIAAVDYDPRLIDHALGAHSTPAGETASSPASPDRAPVAADAQKVSPPPSPGAPDSGYDEPRSAGFEGGFEVSAQAAGAEATWHDPVYDDFPANEFDEPEHPDSFEELHARAHRTAPAGEPPAPHLFEEFADRRGPSNPEPLPVAPIRVRHGGRAEAERHETVDLAGPPSADRRKPRPVSMTLWREGPETTVELSLADDGTEDRRGRDLVDWEPVRPTAAPEQPLPAAQTQPAPRGQAFSPEPIARPQSDTQPPPRPVPDAAASAPPRPRITAQRYAEIEDDPVDEAAPEASAADELADEVVELSSATPAQTAGVGSSTAKGSFLTMLASVARGSDHRRDRTEEPAAARDVDAVARRRERARDVYARSLGHVGVSDRLIRQLLEEAEQATGRIDWPALAQRASTRLLTLDQEIVDRGGVVALVGPTGVGKTTSIGKLAARFALKHGRDRLAMITTDTFRVGAHEQAETYSRILGVPLFQADDPKSFSSLMRRLSRHRLVLIDTAGMGQRDLRLAEELELLSRSRANVQVLLTLSANTERRTMLDTITRFAEVKPIGCVVTKMDETMAPGTALSALIETGLPLAYMSNGQNVPEDLHWARSKRFSLVQQVFHQADMESRDLIEDVHEVRESA